MNIFKSKSSRKKEFYEKSDILKKNSFPIKAISDEETFNKTFEVENNETLKINKAMLVMKIQHDIRQRKKKSATA